MVSYSTEENMLLPVMTYWDTETQTYIRQTIMHNDGIPIASDGASAKGALLKPEKSLGVKIKLLNERAKLPTRSNPDDAGMDIYSTEDVVLESRFSGQHSDVDPARAMVSTGLSFEIPQGLGLFVWDRSGLSAKFGVHRVAGVLDSSYRGELKIALVNLSNKQYIIKAGDRIAQYIVAPIILTRLIPVDQLTDTNRGAGGFGSTGK